MKRTSTVSTGSFKDLGAMSSGLYAMYLAALPLFLILFQSSLTGMLSAIFQLGLFGLALWLISSGQKVQAAYDAADTARRPRLPRKLMGSMLIGLLVLILAGLQFHDATVPIALSVTAFCLSVLAFGLDPMQGKGRDRPEAVTRRNVDRMTEHMNHRMDSVAARIETLRDDDLLRQTRALQVAIDRLLRTATYDGSQLHHLRGPLKRLLAILEEETERLSEDWRTERHNFARLRYLAKLITLGRTFEKRAREVSLADGRDKYELEADLLLDRMQTRAAA